MKTRPWCFALLFLAGSFPTRTLALPGLWLHIASVTTSTFICQGGETETFIYRDGLVVMRTVGRDGVATFLRATAPREAMRDLEGALGENRVGFVRRWWGNGYATEAARAALDYAFTVLKRNRVISLIHPENRASIRVAERLGESLQGRTDDLGREMLCYGIDRESHAAQNRVHSPMRTRAA